MTEVSSGFGGFSGFALRVRKACGLAENDYWGTAEQHIVPGMRELVEEELTGSIIGAFYEVYNTLGFGFLEHI